MFSASLLDVRDLDRGVPFDLEVVNPVTMSGNHAGCSVEIIEPEALVAAYGDQLPSRAKVTCS